MRQRALEKETDILDVWFDSGVSHAAVLEQRDDLRWPADLYLEGSDQHRGWFHSSLLTAVGTRGRAPYEAVLTHGFVVDADGQKMSKSLGNIIAPKKVIEQYGAEILRLVGIGLRLPGRHPDLRQDPQAAQRCLPPDPQHCRFMLGNLTDFDPQPIGSPTSDAGNRPLCPPPAPGTDPTDRARLTMPTSFTPSITACTTTARWICRLSTWTFSRTDSTPLRLPPIQRRSAQTVLYTVLDAMVRLMAPILSFTAEEIWRFMPADTGKSGQCAQNRPARCRPGPVWIRAFAENWQRLLTVRGEVTKALEAARTEKVIGHPLDAAVTLAPRGDLYEQLAPYKDDLRSIFIVSARI